MNLFKRLFSQKEKPKGEKETTLLDSHYSLVALKEKIETDENIVIDDSGYLKAFEAWEELNDDSEFMDQIREELIRGGIEKAKYHSSVKEI